MNSCCCWCRDRCVVREGKVLLLELDSHNFLFLASLLRFLASYVKASNKERAMRNKTKKKKRRTKKKMILKPSRKETAMREYERKLSPYLIAWDVKANCPRKKKRQIVIKESRKQIEMSKN